MTDRQQEEFSLEHLFNGGTLDEFNNADGEQASDSARLNDGRSGIVHPPRRQLPTAHSTRVGFDQDDEPQQPSASAKPPPSVGHRARGSITSDDPTASYTGADDGLGTGDSHQQPAPFHGLPRPAAPPLAPLAQQQVDPLLASTLQLLLLEAHLHQPVATQSEERLLTGDITGLYEPDETDRVRGTPEALQALYDAVTDRDLCLPETCTTVEFAQSTARQLQIAPQALLNALCHAYIGASRSVQFEGVPVQFASRFPGVDTLLYWLRCVALHDTAKFCQLLVFTRDTEDDLYVQVLRAFPTVEPTHTLCLYRVLRLDPNTGETMESWMAFTFRPLPLQQQPRDRGAGTPPRPDDVDDEGDNSGADAPDSAKRPAAPTAPRFNKARKLGVAGHSIRGNFNGYGNLTVDEVLFEGKVPSDHIYGEIILDCGEYYSNNQLADAINQIRVREGQNPNNSSSWVTHRVSEALRSRAARMASLEGETDQEKYLRISAAYDRMRSPRATDRQIAQRRKQHGTAPARVGVGNTAVDVAEGEELLDD